MGNSSSDLTREQGGACVIPIAHESECTQAYNGTNSVKYTQYSLIFGDITDNSV